MCSYPPRGHTNIGTDPLRRTDLLFEIQSHNRTEDAGAFRNVFFNRDFRDFAAEFGAEDRGRARIRGLPQTERGPQPVGVHAAAGGFIGGEGVQEFDQVAASGGIIRGGSSPSTRS